MKSFDINKESFDINNISKKMPYAAPGEEFFEALTRDTMARVQREDRLRRVWRGAIATMSSVITIAAAIVVYLNVAIPTGGEEQMLNRYDEDLDAYVANLSDDELSTLFYDMEIEGDFYSNLNTF